MKKRPFHILISLLLINFSCIAQTEKKFIGTWEGVINVGTPLRVVFHITETNGNWKATADSPNQDNYGLPCDTVLINAGNITIEMKDLNATFTGKLVNDSTIDGKLTQGIDIPLLLKKQKGDAVPVQKQAPAVTATPTTYTSTDVSVQAKDVTLSGTLFHPLNSPKTNVVLIIAGSGPTDRNGNNSMLPGKNNSLLQLGDSLAQHGIASLRYDKRGIGKSRMSSGTAVANSTINDIADDAKALYDWLKKEGYKNIYIAGHSEGSLIGMMIAPAVKPQGFISIAGGGRKIGDILKEQIASTLSPDEKTELSNSLDSLEKGLSVVKISPSLMNFLNPSIQPYMKSWLPLDPQKLIAQLSCPVLVAQGTADLQVKEEDAQLLYKASKKATLVTIKDMNHVLKEVSSGDKKDNVAAYSDPSLPVSGSLIVPIVKFILQPAGK